MKNINLIIHDSGVAEEGIFPSTYVIPTPFTSASREMEQEEMFHFKMAVHEAYDNVLAAGLCGNVTAHYDFEMDKEGISEELSEVSIANGLEYLFRKVTKLKNEEQCSSDSQ